MGHGPEMLAGVVIIQPLLSLGKTVSRQIPNPDRPVGHHQHPGGLCQTMPLGFGKELIPQAVNPLAGHDGPTAQNLRACLKMWRQASLPAVEGGSLPPGSIVRMA